MTIRIDAPKVWHDCSVEGPRPRISPWYNYEARRDNHGAWRFDGRQVIFCPIFGLNLEEAYKSSSETIE